LEDHASLLYSIFFIFVFFLLVGNITSVISFDASDFVGLLLMIVEVVRLIVMSFVLTRLFVLHRRESLLLSVLDIARFIRRVCRLGKLCLLRSYHLRTEQKRNSKSRYYSSNLDDPTE
jgi:hypothetical protein